MLLLDKPFAAIAHDLDLFAEREQMGLNALEALRRRQPNPLIDRALAETQSAVETAIALAALFRRWEGIEENVRDVLAGIGAMRAQWLVERMKAAQAARRGLRSA